MSDAPKRWANLRESISAMAAYPEGYFWHIAPKAAQSALSALGRYEAQGCPPPLLLPEDGGDLTLVWRSSGWSIYRTFEADGEAHDQAIWGWPTPDALSEAPEVQSLIDKAVAEERERCALIADAHDYGDHNFVSETDLLAATIAAAIRAGKEK